MLPLLGYSVPPQIYLKNPEGSRRVSLDLGGATGDNQGMNRLALIAVAVLLLPLPAYGRKAAPPKVILGKIVGVTDGDTVKVLDGNKTLTKICLLAIDAPEKKQAYGNKSKQALSEKIFGKEVRVEWRTLDKYGRTLGMIFLDKRNINLEMVQGGWAWHYKHFDNSPEFAEAELKARAAKLGLWADTQQPVAPWDFREQQRKP